MPFKLKQAGLILPAFSKQELISKKYKEQLSSTNQISYEVLSAKLGEGVQFKNQDCVQFTNQERVQTIKQDRVQFNNQKQIQFTYLEGTSSANENNVAYTENSVNETALVGHGPCNNNGQMTDIACFVTGVGSFGSNKTAANCQEPVG